MSQTSKSGFKSFSRERLGKMKFLVCVLAITLLQYVHALEDPMEGKAFSQFFSYFGITSEMATMVLLPNLKPFEYMLRSLEEFRFKQNVSTSLSC